MSKSGAIKDLSREEEKLSARKERDEKLKEINKRYEEESSALRSKAHADRQKIWDKWRERRSES